MKAKSKLPRWVTSLALFQSGLDRDALLRMSRNLRGTDVNTLTRAEIEDWIQAVARQNNDLQLNQADASAFDCGSCPYRIGVMLCLLRFLRALATGFLRSRRDLLLENLRFGNSSQS